jgi:hypothetical protein
VVITAVVVLFRALRSRHPNPKYIPTPFLKRLWTDWKVSSYRRGDDRYQLDDDDYTSTGRASRIREGQDDDAIGEGQSHQSAQAANREAGAAIGGVDRNTSVRSVMTLPVYRPRAADTERVLGREGERDGIDMVVELPTAEEEETLREEEMDALYQIRLARRRQIAEREERRRLRQEARDRNDFLTLDQLRADARAAAGSNSQEVDELRRTHGRIRDSRQRVVSSVSYHDVGVARHDGTRIRANSTESERVGLLSDTASIALSARSASGSAAETLSHRRERSTSSALSIDTTHGPEQHGSPNISTGGSTFSHQIVAWARSRGNSGATTPRPASSQRAGSSPELIDAEDGDLGDADMPPTSPPGYDEVSLDEATPAHSRASMSSHGSTVPYNEPPPDYPGPMEARNRRLTAQVADLVAETATGPDSQPRRTPGAVVAVPRLPSLRLDHLPQIVVEPSSEHPQDDHR